MGNLGDALKKAGVGPTPGPERRGRADAPRSPAAPPGPRPEPPAEPPRPAPLAREARDPNDRAPGDGATTAKDLIRRTALPLPTGGRRRFHYELSDGSLPYLLVDDRLGRALEAGEVAIVHDGQAPHLLPAAAVPDLARLDPGAIRYFAG